MRAHFDYNPRQDRLIPSQDAGMPFRRGDIIKVLNQEDNFWWQVSRQGHGTGGKWVWSHRKEGGAEMQGDDFNLFVLGCACWRSHCSWADPKPDLGGKVYSN